MRARDCLFFITLAVAAARGAEAACAPGERTTVPISVGLSGEFLIPVTIKGDELAFIVDTGAAATLLDRHAADKLGLKHEVIPGRYARGANGNVVNLARATVPDLEIAGQRLGKATMLVSLGARHGGSSGFLGADILLRAGIEFDLENRLMRLYHAGGCERSGPDWTEARPSIPLTIESGRMLIDVLLDGVHLRALIDSGASRTTLTWKAAEKLRLTRNSPGVASAGAGRGLDGQPIAQSVYRFQTLKVGQEVIEKPVLIIGELGDFGFDMLLGADYIYAHQLYIDPAQKRVFTRWNGNAFARGR